MDKFKIRPYREPLWTHRRICRTIAASADIAITAFLLGTPYGAWTIFQPAPHPKAGPISLYLVAALGFAITAGYWAGRRVYMIDQGYGDPGHGMVVFLSALAVSCVGIWSAYVVAEAHTPAASQRLAISTPAAPLDQSAAGEGSSTSPRPLLVIPGADPHSCGGGMAQACSNLLIQVHETTYASVKRIERMCQLIYAQNSSAELIETCDGYKLLINGVNETKRVLEAVARVTGLPIPEMR